MLMQLTLADDTGMSQGPVLINEKHIIFIVGKVRLKNVVIVR